MALFVNKANLHCGRSGCIVFEGASLMSLAQSQQQAQLCLLDFAFKLTMHRVCRNTAVSTPQRTLHLLASHPLWLLGACSGGNKCTLGTLMHPTFPPFPFTIVLVQHLSVMMRL